MKLYHGSIVSVDQPRIIPAETGRDFGTAFYTTDIQDKAERWALRRARIAQRNGIQHATPIVSVYDHDETKATTILNIKTFIEADMSWLDFVLNCRSNIQYSHGFDLVIGKIANDRVGETIAYVQAGIMCREDALERLKFQKINNQIAFCTHLAMTCLKYQTCYTLSQETKP